MEPMQYFERQHARWGYLFIMTTLVLLSLAYYFRWGTHPIPFVGYVVLMIVFVGTFFLFCKMDTYIDDENLHIRYGLFGFSKIIALSEVAEVKQIKYPWAYGVGIRMLPESTLYSVNFSELVEIKLKENTHSISLGTANAAKLIEVLQKTTAKTT